MTPERRIDQYASRQYGVLSTDQARRAGLTEDMIRYRVGTGAWIRLAPRVYAVASAPPKWERQVAAAVLSRPQAIVSGPTAAALHRFEGFRRSRIEITVPAGANARSPMARVTRSIWFADIGTTHIDGFPVADEAETLVVLAGRIAIGRLVHLIDERLTAGSLAVEDFERIRRRIAGGRVRGTNHLFPILDARASDGWEPPGTELEAYLDRLVDHPGVPACSRQHPFRFDERSMIVDIYIALWRLILEVDGRRWHTRQADFERDRARDNAAAAQGIAVLRFTWRMLTEDFDGCRRTLFETGAARTRIA